MKYFGLSSLENEIILSLWAQIIPFSCDNRDQIISFSWDIQKRAGGGGVGVSSEPTEPLWIRHWDAIHQKGKHMGFFYLSQMRKTLI